MPNRRTVIRTSLGFLAATPFVAAGARADEASVAEIASGKIRGASSDGLHAFKGVPYGASTAGANRFMPPGKPEPWTGIREASAYAGRSPQGVPARSARNWRESGDRAITCPSARIA